MATKAERKKAARLRRRKHIRKVVHGTSDRPRLVVTRSLKHISASLVDDDRGVTLTGVMDSTLKEAPKEKEAKADTPDDEKKDKKKKAPVMGTKVATAYRVGQAIAEIAKEKGITRVVFDRNGLRYQGRIKAVADGARKGGLEF